MIFGHYIRNFVRFHACFGAFWNLTAKANKTDPIRPLVPANGLEGARAPCAPRLDPPMLRYALGRSARAVCLNNVSIPYSGTRIFPISMYLRLCITYRNRTSAAMCVVTALLCSHA